MAIARNFRNTIPSRALRDPDFRRGSLIESIENMLSGDLRTGKTLLRDYINATVGFQKLVILTKKNPIRVYDF